jgi:hypothetical protein
VTKKKNLTDEEKLNIEAAKLTHIARKLPDIKYYSELLTNQVNFKLNGKYLNSHIPKMVNLAFHSMVLRKYYTTKYGWSSKTIDSIWWTVYFRSITSYSDQDKLRIKKFVNNRWATRYRDQKYYK